MGTRELASIAFAEHGKVLVTDADESRVPTGVDGVRAAPIEEVAQRERDL
jgi:hypothetical protein